MNLPDKSVDRLKYPTRVKLFLAMAFCCCAVADGFAQLIYLTDTRSVSGSAVIENINYAPPFYVSSYSPYSGSATPSAPFADFMGDASGTAEFVGVISNSNNGQLTPYSGSAGIDSEQTSFLHSDELYYSSQEIGSGATPQFSSQGTSSLQVTFQVSSPVAYNLSLRNTGDLVATANSFSLSSSSQGTLVSENTRTPPIYQYLWNVTTVYSGTFTPGNTYTMTLQSTGGDADLLDSSDGGGLTVDLTVPEPSMTSLAGLGFVVFLLRAHRIGRRAVRGS